MPAIFSLRIAAAEAAAIAALTCAANCVPDKGVSDGGSGGALRGGSGGNGDVMSGVSLFVTAPGEFSVTDTVNALEEAV